MLRMRNVTIQELGLCIVLLRMAWKRNNKYGDEPFSGDRRDANGNYYDFDNSHFIL